MPPWVPMWLHHCLSLHFFHFQIDSCLHVVTFSFRSPILTISIIFCLELEIPEKDHTRKLSLKMSFLGSLLFALKCFDQFAWYISAFFSFFLFYFFKQKCVSWAISYFSQNFQNYCFLIYDYGSIYCTHPMIHVLTQTLIHYR